MRIIDFCSTTAMRVTSVTTATGLLVSAFESDNVNGRNRYDGLNGHDSYNNFDGHDGHNDHNGNDGNDGHDGLNNYNNNDS